MQLKMRIHNYKPTDIRCMKDSRPHSFVVVTGSKLEQELEDSVLLIEYSDKGFKLTLGDLGFTPEDTFEASIENVYLPKAEGKHNGGFQEIIDWTYEHKDEKYVDPTTTPELNMGKRVFNYVVSLVKWIWCKLLIRVDNSSTVSYSIVVIVVNRTTWNYWFIYYFVDSAVLNFVLFRNKVTVKKHCRCAH